MSDRRDEELRRALAAPPLKDRLAPGLRVLFVGINPGVRTAITGHHFAGYSNRFWKLLCDSRLVPEPLRSEDDERLPEWGFGITNLIARPTPGIDTLKPDEYIAGARTLRKMLLVDPHVDDLRLKLQHLGDAEIVAINDGIVRSLKKL